VWLRTTAAAEECATGCPAKPSLRSWNMRAASSASSTGSSRSRSRLPLKEPPLCEGNKQQLPTGRCRQSSRSSGPQRSRARQGGGALTPSSGRGQPPGRMEGLLTAQRRCSLANFSTLSPTPHLTQRCKVQRGPPVPSKSHNPVKSSR